MSQFWQKRQPRLQPAVPKESTVEPGWKWLSGFFSIGSTAKPVVVPQPAVTRRPPRFRRMKQNPSCPSPIRHSRGQRVQSTFPSARRLPVARLVEHDEIVPRRATARPHRGGRAGPLSPGDRPGVITGPR